MKLLVLAGWPLGKTNSIEPTESLLNVHVTSKSYPSKALKLELLAKDNLSASCARTWKKSWKRYWSVFEFANSYDNQRGRPDIVPEIFAAIALWTKTRVLLTNSKLDSCTLRWLHYDKFSDKNFSRIYLKFYRMRWTVKSCEWVICLQKVWYQFSARRDIKIMTCWWHHCSLRINFTAPVYHCLWKSDNNFLMLFPPFSCSTARHDFSLLRATRATNNAWNNKCTSLNGRIMKPAYGLSNLRIKQFVILTAASTCTHTYASSQ